MPNRRWISEYVTRNTAQRVGMPISILCIPGTHDSCTALLSPAVEQYIQGIAKCQDLSLRAQYDKGIRYFDIRVRVEGQNLYIVHDGPIGMMDCYCYYDDPVHNVRRLMELDDVIDTFIEELEIQKPESQHYDFVIMSIKLSNSSRGYENVLANYLTQKQLLTNCFCQTNNPVITVGAAAKKIVLLNRVNGMPPNINNFSIDASQWGVNGNKGLVTTDITKLNVWVQDEYNITEAQRKMDEYNEVNRYARDGLAGVLVLNHLSCTNVKNPIEWSTWLAVKVLAGRINQKFEEDYGQNIENIRGVTVMDFPTDNEIDMIIQSNGSTQIRYFAQYPLYVRL